MVFIEDVSVLSNCVGSRNPSGLGNVIEVTMHSKSRVVFGSPTGYAQSKRFVIIIIIMIIKTTAWTVSTEPG
jgi:hypothetical protein